MKKNNFITFLVLLIHPNFEDLSYSNIPLYLSKEEQYELVFTDGELIDLE